MKHRKHTNMRRNLHRALALLLACTAFFTTALVQTDTAEAATTSISTSFVGKKAIFSYDPWAAGSSKTKTVKADLTRDNKKDTIKVKATAYSNGDYVKKLTVTLKGKTALSLTFSNGDALGVTVKYLRQSKNKEYLYVNAYTENDYTTCSRIYRYNSSTGKLKCVLKAESTIDDLHTSTVSSVTKDTIKITYTAQPELTGYIKWTYNYVYKDGKLTRKAVTTTNVHSKLGDWEAVSSAYRSYFAKDKYITQKTLTLYKSAGSSTVSATIAAGKTVSMDKIRVKDKTIYLYFTCGSKSGWVPAKSYYNGGEDDTDTFCGVLYAG